MEIIQKILSFVLSLIIPYLPAASVIGYGGYEPIIATEREYVFDDERLNIGGYGYNLKYSDEEHFSQIKEAGLDFLITSVNEALMSYCDENDIGIVAHGYNTSGGGWNAYNPSHDMSLTPNNFKMRPCLWGDSIVDEPNSKLFDDLAATVNHYYSLGTKTLPLINLYPNSFIEAQAGFDYYEFSDFENNLQKILRSTDFRTKLLPIITYNNEELYNKFALISYTTNQYLELYKRYVSMYISKVDTDIISVDIYPLGVNDDTSVAWLSNLDVLAEACRETGRKLWVITQACGSVNHEVSDARYCDNPADIRYQMYVSLAFGAKSVIHACFSSGWWDDEAWLVDKNGNKTKTFDAVKTVNEEVASFADIYANYNYKGTFLKNAHGSDGTWYEAYLTPISREDRGCDVDTKDHILTGCFDSKDGNSNAYTFVNMNGSYTAANAHFTATFDDAKSVTIYQKGVATTYEGNEISLKLECEEGVFVTVEK